MGIICYLFVQICMDKLGDPLLSIFCYLYGQKLYGQTTNGNDLSFVWTKFVWTNNKCGDVAMDLLFVWTNLVRTNNQIIKLRDLLFVHLLGQN